MKMMDLRNGVLPFTLPVAFSVSDIAEYTILDNSRDKEFGGLFPRMVLYIRELILKSI